MKILNIVTSGLQREGISTTQLEFMRAMRKEKIAIHMAAVHNNAPDLMADFECAGCKVIEFPDRKEHVIKYLLFLYQQLKQEKYDAVHVHGSSAIMCLDLLAAKLAGVSVRIAHSRNTRSDHDKVDKLLRPLFYRSYTHAFSCGQEAGEWLFGGREFTTIHNGKDLAKFKFSPEIRGGIRERNGLQDHVAVGFVGNLNQQKNIPFLMEVIGAYHRIDPNSEFYIMGDGAERDYAVEMVERLGLGKKVHFTGRISNVHEMLQAMDIMLLPSLFEGLPNVVLEWQAEGLPCLISDRITRECAPSDLVTFKPLEDGAEAWAAKLHEIVYNAGDRMENAQRATAALREAGFDIEKNARDLEAFYESLGNKKG